MKLKSLTSLGAAAMALLLSSCGNQSPSGFLSNYNQLSPGGNAYGAKMSYTKPNMDFAKYDSVIIDPVTFILPTDSKLTEADRQRLSYAMRQAITRELSKDYKLVSTPGPTTMRFRGAVTELIPANRPANVITSVVPVSRVVAEAQQMTTGISMFSSRGSGEMEILDSVSGERLVALADTRYARKAASSSATSWGQIEEAMGNAAADVRKGLAKLRARKP
ncbi:DUF3313 domain-containing protein [Verrucomicrobiaceae bacterium N1E253]|uniref:DUF3313 domain-containing protein n=1 Tax=Oceaniferula marina TaxID=2748318 RepID=A0A851GGR3_9BACT|nr:DUF3313 domain-containing protein [Oceaniferula marina]NWK56978.1 DUF3313 domain-containing protein [Oceaniferula marina]